LISLLIRYPVLVLGFILAVSAAGVDLSSFGLMAGALGVGIGFGMQNIIGNFVSGVILTFERPIQVGDTIAVGSLLGNVSEIGVRSSKVKTFDGAEVIVPNSDLISKEVINWTLSDRRRKMKVEIKVGFSSNPHDVAAILRRTAAEHPATLEDPPPKVLFQGYSESGLDFQLQFWVQFEQGLGTRSEVLLKIYDALGEAGIKPPIPRREVTMKDGEDSPEFTPENEYLASEGD
jgi:small-conductance mechanosensitive channel